MIAAVALFALAVSASAGHHHHKRAAHSIKKLSKLDDSKAKDILVGILEGISDDYGNVTLCIDDTDDALADLETFEHDVEHGIREKNGPLIEAGFAALAAGLKYLADAANECGVEHVAEDIATIIGELETPGGVIKVIEQEGMHIFMHGTEITKDLILAVVDYKTHLWSDFGFRIGKVLGYLL